MRDDMQQFLADADRLGAVVAAVDDWSAPTPCDEWDAAALLDHVVATERDFLAGRGRALPDEGADVLADPPARWTAHRAALGPVVADDAFTGSTFDGAFGETTVADTLTTFYGLDLLVHRADLARSNDLDPALDDAELDRIEAIADRLGSKMWEMGATKPPVEVPAGADRAARVLARLGRPPV